MNAVKCPKYKAGNISVPDIAMGVMTCAGIVSNGVACETEGVRGCRIGKIFAWPVGEDVGNIVGSIIGELAGGSDDSYPSNKVGI